MPSAPRRPCPVPGCPELVVHGRCPRHSAQRRRLHDEHRGSSAQRGYDARHRRWRTAVLNRDPLCVGYPQGHHGEHPPASTVADHVVALEDGGGWELDVAGTPASGYAPRLEINVRRADAQRRA